MNFQDLQQRAAYLSAFGSYWESAPAPEWPVLINRALSIWSWDTEYNLETLTLQTLSTQAEYTLDATTDPRYFKYILDCVLGTSSPLVQTTEQTERSRDALWLVRTPSTPARYFSPEPNVLRLVPTPSLAGDTITLRGPREAPRLVAATDSPVFPTAWQEAVALIAVTLYAEQYVSQTPEFQRLGNYQKQIEAMSKAMRRWYGDDDAQLQRTMKRRMPDRVDTAGYNYYPS